MYILKNALKSITRNKARNILIGIIILVIATSSCVALSIREAAETAKEDTLSSLEITGKISYDRSAAMSNAQASGGNIKGSFSMPTLSLDEYINYASAQGEGDSYYYSNSIALNATGDLEAYSSSDSETTTNSFMSGGGGGGKMSAMSQGDFTITGYSSYNAMISLFGEDGSYSITDGQMFDEESSDLTVIISDELAMYNNLSVGDTITLANTNNEEETYTLSINGIYTNTASSEGEQMFSMTDPANNIYMSYNGLAEIINSSEAVATTTTDSNGMESSTALRNQLSFTYTFANVNNYNSFAENVYNLGLDSNFIVSSSDLSAYESSLAPLETLSTMAGWFFLIVLIIGGVILVVLNIFNLRERKYEVGVLTAIGMKKLKVATQFICELFAITLIAITIGTSTGAAISVPVTNNLLASQIESAQESSNAINENFGFSKGQASNGGGSSNVNVTSNKMPNGFGRTQQISYVDSISSATNFTVVIQLVLVGILLTIISGLAALVSIMRYEPLKILSSRS